MTISDWQGISSPFRELLLMDTSPVALTCREKRDVTEQLKAQGGKVRICRAVLDASGGKEVVICRKNNACFGAVWHLGFQKLQDPEVRRMTKQFVVEGEKLFSSHDALENLLMQMEDVPDNAHNCFYLSPLETTRFEPQLVIFNVNPDQACRLLTFVTFLDGHMPQIKIGGPTCRMAIIYPLLTGEVNLSFYDYTARRLCHVPDDKLIISIPAAKIPLIIDSIDKCTAGTAKIEYPQEFREFLQRRTKVASKK